MFINNFYLYFFYVKSFYVMVVCLGVEVRKIYEDWFGKWLGEWFY